MSDSGNEASDIEHVLKACWRGSNIGAEGDHALQGFRLQCQKRDIFLFPESVKALSVFDMKIPFALVDRHLASRRPLEIARTGEQIQARWLGRTAAGAHY